jgi:adenosine deaminase CECR1
MSVPTLTPDRMWTRFNKVGTPIWKHFFMHESVLREYTQRLIKNGLDQGIYYQEWRTVFLTPKPVIDTKGNKQGHEYYLNIMNQEIKKARSNPQFVGAKIIWCVSREFGLKHNPEFLGVDWQVDHLIELRNKKEYQSLIAGFDIVGEEDRDKFHTNDEYLSAFNKLLKGVRDKDKYPFGLALHAGESIHMEKGSKSRKNLEFAASISKNNKDVNVRIGHGVGLRDLPDLIHDFDEQNIHVELCPISNHFLGTCKNARDFATYGGPILDSLSCSYNGDDPTYQR